MKRGIVCVFYEKRGRFFSKFFQGEWSDAVLVSIVVVDKHSA
jgi:hypothetical protein